MACVCSHMVLPFIELLTSVVAGCQSLAGRWVISVPLLNRPRPLRMERIFHPQQAGCCCRCLSALWEIQRGLEKFSEIFPCHSELPLIIVKKHARQGKKKDLEQLFHLINLNSSHLTPIFLFYPFWILLYPVQFIYSHLLSSHSSSPLSHHTRSLHFYTRSLSYYLHHTTATKHLCFLIHLTKQKFCDSSQIYCNTDFLVSIYLTIGKLILF